MPITKIKGSKKYLVRVNYTDEKGNYKSKYRTVKTYNEAVEVYQELYANRNCNEQITLKELCEQYLADCQLRCKLSTYSSTKGEITTILRTAGHNIQVYRITPMFIRRWQTKILNMKYKASSVYNLNKRFKSLLEFCIKFYGLRTNAVQEAGNIGNLNTIQNNYWTMDEFNTFIKGVDKEKDCAAYVLFNLLFYTGCRIGEALALYATDINFDENTIHISKTYQVLEGRRLLTAPKTQESKRVIVIPPFLTKMLHRYIQKLPVPNIRLFFCINRSYVSKLKRQVCAKTGVKNIKLHEFRHSAISLLMNKEVAPVEISAYVGHSNPNITYAVYTHQYKNRDLKIAEAEDEDLAKWDI